MQTNVMTTTKSLEMAVTPFADKNKVGGAKVGPLIVQIFAPQPVETAGTSTLENYVTTPTMMMEMDAQPPAT